jgi:hypothetical protein
VLPATPEQNTKMPSKIVAPVPKNLPAALPCSTRI